MRVLLLGGTGVFGKSAATLLAREKEITEIAIASRHLATAQRIASEIGDKARAVCVDIKDLTRLSSIASDYNIIVNAAGPTSEVQVPAIQAAIEAGVHYCDLGVIGRTAEKALKLNAQAQAKGVTAIIGTGWCALRSLMAVHAAHQLDEIDALFACFQFDYSPGGFFSPDNFLTRAREQGRVETSAIDIMECARGPVKIYRAGSWLSIEPIEYPMEIIHPSGAMITAYPFDALEAVTLPRYLPVVKNISILMSFVPPPLNELILHHGRRMAKDETDPAKAIVAFYEEALADKNRWLSTPPGFPGGWLMWAGVTGRKNGRQARYICWPGPSMVFDWTNVPLIIVALRILRGEITLHGVMPPEACIELGSFLEEATKYVHETSREIHVKRTLRLAGVKSTYTTENFALDTLILTIRFHNDTLRLAWIKMGTVHLVGNNAL